MVGTSRRRLLPTLIPDLRQRFALQTLLPMHFPLQLSNASPHLNQIFFACLPARSNSTQNTPLPIRLKKINAFMVEDRPGGQFITLRGRSTIDENIKIEATMFYGVSPNMDEDDNEPNAQLHISLLVDVFKGEGGDMLEFVYSAWPQRLKIQKLYVIGLGGTLSRPYIGPDFRVLDKKLQSAMYKYLNARGVNNDLCLFLHRYVWNKDKIEHIQRLKLLKSYVEK